MKKLILVLWALLMGVYATAQVAYKVTCEGLEDGQTVYLLNAENREVLDSMKVADKAVSFSGTLPEATVALLGYKPNAVRGPIVQFVIDGKPIVIADKKIKEGSALNLRYGQYQEAAEAHNQTAEAIMQDYRALQAQYGNDIPEDKMEALRERMEDFSEKSHELSLKMMEENRDNLIPLTMLLYSADNLGYDYVGDYMQTYAYADRPSLQPVKNMLAREAVKRPGAKVVDFEMKNLQGATVRLTDYVGRGNYVLVDFWASWCGPCRAEMPNVKADYEKYHPLGFEIVGVSLDNKQEAWEKGVRDLGITWPQMSDLKGWQCEGAALYNIRAIPATVLFAPDGTVVASGLRGEELSKKLAEIYE